MRRVFPPEHAARERDFIDLVLEAPTFFSPSPSISFIPSPFSSPPHFLTRPFWFFSSPNCFILPRHLSGSGHGRVFLQTNPNMPFPAFCFPDLFAGLCVLLRRFPSEPSGGPHAVVLLLFCSFLFTLHFLSPSLPAKDEPPFPPPMHVMSVSSLRSCPRNEAGL